MANAHLLFTTNIQVYRLITLTRLLSDSPDGCMLSYIHVMYYILKEVKVNLNPAVIVITAAQWRELHTYQRLYSNLFHLL